ncbi:MAG: NfeD family protein [Rhodospirillales bacterium]|nr:NfeD family protein [Rhodospirillales bacterium]
MGIAAIITGLIVFAVDSLSWQSQVLVFAGLSVVSVISGRLWLRSRPTETDHPTLNRRGQQYVGRVFTVDEKMVNGMGKVRVDDTSWKISGDDFDAGTKVRVIAVEGTVLKVEEVLVDEHV